MIPAAGFPRLLGFEPTSARRSFRLIQFNRSIRTLVQKGASTTMNCQKLAACIENLQPQAMPRDVARLCLLLTNFVPNTETLQDESQLTEAWQQMGLRLQAATDQHAAMTEELETLSQSDPEKFSPDQVWVLIRAIKVQSQVLQLYVGQMLDI